MVIDQPDPEKVYQCWIRFEEVGVCKRDSILHLGRHHVTDLEPTVRLDYRGEGYV